MRLRFIALSDTHIGADFSILSYFQGVEHLWESLRAQFGLSNSEILEVDDLVLLGDIIDTTVSLPGQISSGMRMFIEALSGRIRSNRIIFVPGNHDHSLWTGYRASACEQKACGVTSPQGESVLSRGRVPDKKGVSQLIHYFFGRNSLHWKPKKGRDAPDFIVANPIFAEHFGGRTYVFAHGTHFRYEFTMPKFVLKLVAKMLDSTSAKAREGGGAEAIDPLAELERLVSPIIDAFWPPAKSEGYSKRARAYYLFRHLYSKIASFRPAPCDSRLFSRTLLQKAPEPRIADITKDRGGMRRWKKHFLPHLLRFLRSYRIPNEPLTFVYGDTHFGGYGEIAADPEPVRVYNCGGWVVYDPADHPACHVFAVDSHGEEYLADLSFADVKVGDVSLLETAVGSRKPAVIPQETESGAYSHSLVREVVSGSKSLLI